MHKQTFKDPLSSTCQISSERRVLDLESEVQAQVQSSLGVTFCHWIFVHVVKPLMPILALLPMLRVCDNPERGHTIKTTNLTDVTMLGTLGH